MAWIAGSKFPKKCGLRPWKNSGIYQSIVGQQKMADDDDDDGSDNGGGDNTASDENTAVKGSAQCVFAEEHKALPLHFILVKVPKTAGSTFGGVLRRFSSAHSIHCFQPGEKSAHVVDPAALKEFKADVELEVCRDAQ